MRRLEVIAPARLEWVERPTVRLTADDDVIVRPVASTTCDLDRAIIAGITPFSVPVRGRSRGCRRGGRLRSRRRGGEARRSRRDPVAHLVRDVRPLHRRTCRRTVATCPAAPCTASRWAATGAACSTT